VSFRMFFNVIAFNLKATHFERIHFRLTKHIHPPNTSEALIRLDGFAE